MDHHSACVRHAMSLETDEARAASELAQALGDHEASSVLFFCSSAYDLARLAEQLNGRLRGRLIGCTSAGQIGPGGFQRGGISAVRIDDALARLTPFLIKPLSEGFASIDALARSIVDLRVRAPQLGAFGLLLVDGVSLGEERLAAALYQALGNIPMVGGSAGDDLAFERTHVFHAGAFHENAAAFVLAETALPFATFKVQHFVPTSRKLVVTAADEDKRIVHELNGEPAALAYARVLELSVDALEPYVFSQHPVMIEVGGEYFVRSIGRVLPGGSLSMLCAIEEGIVLTVGTGVDPLEAVERSFERVRAQIGAPAFVLGFDCILRRLEFERKELDGRVGALLSRMNVMGFCTYGEQYNALHVNQTFTGVAIGGGDGAGAIR